MSTAIANSIRTYELVWADGRECIRKIPDHSVSVLLTGSESQASPVVHSISSLYAVLYTASAWCQAWLLAPHTRLFLHGKLES